MNLEDIYDYGRSNNVPIILDESLQLLLQTINSSGAKKVLEIGTAIGYSSIAIAKNCTEVHITTLEFSSERVSIAKKNIKNNELSDRIDVVFCDAGEWLKVCEEKFDFVFLDGPKGQYIKYLPDLLRITRVGGIILADNALFKGMVRGGTPVPKAIKTMINNLRIYLDTVSSHHHLDTTIHAVGDGIAISIVK